MAVDWGSGGSGGVYGGGGGGVAVACGLEGASEGPVLETAGSGSPRRLRRGGALANGPRSTGSERARGGRADVFDATGVSAGAWKAPSRQLVYGTQAKRMSDEAGISKPRGVRRRLSQREPSQKGSSKSTSTCRPSANTRTTVPEAPKGTLPHGWMIVTRFSSRRGPYTGGGAATACGSGPLAELRGGKSRLS
jgi:hypothetical protein